jgi:hypothetical protein
MILEGCEVSLCLELLSEHLPLETDEKKGNPISWLSLEIVASIIMTFVSYLSRLLS